MLSDTRDTHGVRLVVEKLEAGAVFDFVVPVDGTKCEQRNHYGTVSMVANSCLTYPISARS